MIHCDDKQKKMQRRPDFAHPQNVVANTVSTRDLSCCYDTSRVQQNPAVYVSSQTGDDAANGGRTASSPVATFEKAIDVLNRIAAWGGEAVVHLMDTVAITGNSSESTPAGVEILRPKIGQARAVKVTGHEPTHTTFRIVDGTSLTPTPPAGLSTWPAYPWVTVSSTMVAGTHARKRFTITHPTTGAIAADGVVCTNTITGFHLIMDYGVDYTGYDLHLIDPVTGATPPRLDLTASATGDVYYLDGDVPLVFSGIDLRTDYARFASHDPCYSVTFERVQWEIGDNSPPVNGERFVLRASYVFATTSGTRQSFVDGPCDRFDIERCWMHDTRIAIGPSTPYGWMDGSPIRFEIHTTVFDGVANCNLAGYGRVVNTAFLNGYGTTPTDQITGNVFYWNSGMSGTNVASAAMGFAAAARATMVNCELVDSSGGTSPVLDINNSTVHFVGPMLILTAQTGGAASNYLINMAGGASLSALDVSLTFAIDANVAATAELAINGGSVASIGSSAATFGAGPTQIDWIDGGGPAAFPVIAGWQQNGSCRVATY